MVCKRALGAEHNIENAQVYDENDLQLHPDMAHILRKVSKDVPGEFHFLPVGAGSSHHRLAMLMQLVVHIGISKSFCATNISVCRCNSNVFAYMHIIVVVASGGERSI